MKLEEMTLDVEQQVEIKAAIGDVFKGRPAPTGRRQYR
jgi:hypothetical protein